MTCKYLKIYERLMTKAILRDYRSERYRIGSVLTQEYTETHHIIPRCLGGTNAKYNLAVLTAKEHFISHLLLTKIFYDCDPIILAFTIMCNRTEGKTAKDYAVFRENYSRIVSEFFKNYWTTEKRLESSKKMLKLSKDPTYRQNVSEGLQRHYKENPKRRQEISQQVKKRMADPVQKQAWLGKYHEYLEEHYKDPKNRKKIGDRVRKENRENPELRKKRIDAIKNHANKKSPQWKELMSQIMTDYCDNPEVKKRMSERVTGGKNPTARKVIDIKTKKVYDCASDAAKALGVNYSTFKKWLYLKIPKHNCMWYDEYLKGENDGNEI